MLSDRFLLPFGLLPHRPATNSGGIWARLGRGARQALWPFLVRFLDAGAMIAQQIGMAFRELVPVTSRWPGHSVYTRIVSTSLPACNVWETPLSFSAPTSSREDLFFRPPPFDVRSKPSAGKCLPGIGPFLSSERGLIG